MKTITSWMLTGALAITSLSCTTTYDAYGNPRQSVDPGTAVAGAAAVGVLGYALAKDNDNDKHKNHNRRVGDKRYGYYDRRGYWHWYR